MGARNVVIAFVGCDVAGRMLDADVAGVEILVQ